MENHDPEMVRAEVRRRYGSIARGLTTLNQAVAPATPSTSSCCAAPTAPADPAPTPAGAGCCGESTACSSQALGYTAADLASLPAGADLGLGCGNPVALASLNPGESVLDLGSGAGLDAFLAAQAVGPSGHVIGVDMTPDMVAKARSNARKAGLAHVEFRLGEIEALPVRDASIDVILSNCVINLCPDKRPVYREAFRVLKPGGRIAVSDVVARGALSDAIRQDLALHTGCVAGATPHRELLELLAEVGFVDITVRPKGNSDAILQAWDGGRGMESQVFAAEVTARKPTATSH